MHDFITRLVGLEPKRATKWSGIRGCMGSVLNDDAEKTGRENGRRKHGTREQPLTRDWHVFLNGGNAQ
jgi:hypothetical protein